MTNHIVEQYKKAVHNREPNEDIPKDSLQDALNWLVVDGQTVITQGSVPIGPEGPIGRVKNQGFGYRTDGTLIHYRKAKTAIQYFNTTTSLWVDIVTGLAETDDFTFSNYSSLSGAFTFATGPAGIFKFHNSVPGSYLDMYNSSRNFKGYSIIDKARMLMWGLTNDPTGLYGSYIDAQTSAVYTTVTNEVLATADGIQTTFSGTLAFKGANPLGNLFGLQINTNPASVTATDDYLGVISGTGVTGTINYITGAYSLTFAAPPAFGAQIRGSYQWENSNSKGVTDFTKSATRLAGEGFILRQDEGGDAIQQVLVGIDDSYYSIKRYSAYRYTPDAADTSPLNTLFRKDIGVLTNKSAIATGIGIIFMNTANPDKPELTVLEKNPLGDNILARILCAHFKFENYEYDKAVLASFGRWTLVACRTPDSLENNRLLLCDISDVNQETVVITDYAADCLAKATGLLYAGSPYSDSVYNLFSGWDDNESIPVNYFQTRCEKYGSEKLKKFRRLRVQGLIQPGQKLQVYVAYDDSDASLVGTILGDGSYVDLTQPVMIGNSMIGETPIGGESSVIEAFPYFCEIKMKTPKFRQRVIQFVATGLGYVSVSATNDWDIFTFEERIPKKYRLKQNVSLDGTETDITPPEF